MYINLYPLINFYLLMIIIRFAPKRLLYNYQLLKFYVIIHIFLIINILVRHFHLFIKFNFIF